jgi:hypothetical protein
MTDHIVVIDVVGKNGEALADKWKDGVKTYLGMSVSGFPNLYVSVSVQPCPLEKLTPCQQILHLWSPGTDRSLQWTNLCRVPRRMDC